MKDMRLTTSGWKEWNPFEEVVAEAVVKADKRSALRWKREHPDTIHLFNLHRKRRLEA